MREQYRPGCEQARKKGCGGEPPAQTGDSATLGDRVVSLTVQWRRNGEMANSDLTNHEFERRLARRIAQEVEKAPALAAKCSDLARILRRELFPKSLVGCVAVSPLYWGLPFLLGLKGPPNETLQLAVNLAGTFVPVCILMGWWGRRCSDSEAIGSGPSSRSWRHT